MHSTLGDVPPDEFEASYYADLNTPYQPEMAPAQKRHRTPGRFKRVDKDGVFHTLWSGDRTEIETETETETETEGSLH